MARIQAVGKKYGIDAHFLLRDQSRLWVADLIKMFPPANRDKGLATIRGDLSRVFKPLGDQQLLGWYKSEFGDRLGDKSEVLFNVNGDQSKAAAWHKSQRNNRGRIPKSRGREIAGKFGPIIIERKMYMPFGSFMKFRRTLEKRVGTLKAGWIPAANALGQSVESWITGTEKHSGSFSDTFHQDGTGSINMTNQVPWNARFENLVNVTGQRRLRMIGFKLPRTMKRIFKQYGFANTDGGGI